jgi:hypothetical protein
MMLLFLLFSAIQIFANPLPANLYFCQEAIFPQAKERTSAEGKWVLQIKQYNEVIRTRYEGMVISIGAGDMAVPWLVAL